MRAMGIFLVPMLLVAGCLAPEEASTSAKFAAVAEKAAPSVVRVEYTLQFDKGEAPRIGGMPSARAYWGGYYYGGDGTEYIVEERPLEVGGFLLSPTEVIAPDLVIHPRFVKSIAVRFGDKVVEAIPDAYAKDQNAVFLKLAEPLSDAKPLEFSDKAPPYLMIDYYCDEGVWITAVRTLSIGVAMTETERQFMPAPPSCLIVDQEGTPIGVSMKDELPMDDSWKCSPLKWSTVSAEAMSAKLAEIEQASNRAVLRVTLNFRSPKKDASMRYFAPSYDDEEGVTERNVPGVLIEKDTVLVLANLEPNVTARLERITVHLAEGEPVSAKFAHTLRDYGCFLATLEEPLEGAVPLSSADVLQCKNLLLPSVEVRIQGEKRIVYLCHNRIIHYGLGWKRKLYPYLLGPLEGVFVFDEEGALVALPVARREKISVRQRWRASEPTLTPAAYVKDVLGDLAANVDANNVPLSEEEENRLAWMGVELQPLNKELARANNVSDLTQDGEMGALVSYVYPDSPAEKTGVEPGFVLLRLHVQGEPKPIDVRVVDLGFSFEDFPWDQLDRVPEQYYDHIPRPWPPVENSFTRALTDLGFGKKYTAEFFCRGEIIMKDFEITQSPPHYDSAPRYKSEALGLTVRDLSYEVRRMFRKKPEDPGVIVSKIEPGSKASVAGIKPYEMITHVNDQPVSGVGDFEKLIAGQDELRLSVLRMTRSRLVKIKMALPKEIGPPPEGEGIIEPVPPEMEEEAPAPEEPAEEMPSLEEEVPAEAPAAE